MKKPVREYSTAIQQMVALARAVSSDAKMVIMDESTSSLDEREVELLFSVVRRLRDDGRAVIFVSHRLDELYALCDRVTVMRDGQTVAESTMQDMDKLRLVKTMLGRTLAAVVHEDSAVKEANLAKRGGLALSAQDCRPAQKSRTCRSMCTRAKPSASPGCSAQGRTETMRLLFGADRRRRGPVSMNGETVAWKSPKDAIAHGVAYLTEDRKAEGIVPELSVRDNLTLVCQPALTKRGIVDVARQKKIVDGFIESLGIKLRSADQPIRELSGGNQQKVLLARWLAAHPRLLLLDEPTRGIDVGAKADVAKIVRELRDSGWRCCCRRRNSKSSRRSRIARSLSAMDGPSRSSTARDMSEAAIMDAIAHGAGERSTLAEAVEEAKHDR